MKPSHTYKKAKITCTDPALQGMGMLLDYGPTACAEVLTCSQGIARNKLNPDIDTNRLTLDEAVTLSEKFDDDRQLAAWAARRSKALFDLPKGSVSDDELTDQILQAAEKFGAICQEIKEAREDGVIDHDEREKVKQCALELISAVMNLDAEIASQVRTLPTAKRA